MQVAVLKYNAGNIFSVMNALRRLGVEPLLTDHADELREAADSLGMTIGNIEISPMKGLVDYHSQPA